MEYNFSPSFKLDSLNVNNVIEAFKERIEEYYFEPIKMLNEKNFGFAATSLLASLIDILAKTENHDTRTENIGGNYKNWLKNNLGFGQKLAKDFYYNFRCGLLHAGCVESSGQISYSQKELYGYDKEHLILNPNILFQRLKMKFNEFIKIEDPEDLFEYLKKKLNEID